MRAILELENGIEIAIDGLKRIHYNNYQSDLPDDFDEYAVLAGASSVAVGPEQPDQPERPALDVARVDPESARSEKTTDSTGAFIHPDKQYLIFR